MKEIALIITVLLKLGLISFQQGQKIRLGALYWLVVGPTSGQP